MVHIDFPEYDVHADGSVWRNESRKKRWGPAKPLVPVYNAMKYASITMVKMDGSFERIFVHRLVASVYHGMDLYDMDFEPDHKDRDPSNNHKDNLEVVTRSENMRRAKGRGAWSVTDTHKECSRCGIMRPRDEFTKNSRSTTGLGGKCAGCRKEYRESTSKGLSRI